MRDHPNDYIIENVTIPTLTLSVLLSHCSDSLNTVRRSFFEIQAESVEVNYGVFTNASPVIDFPLVSVSQLQNTLILSCPCNTPKRKLCEHQAQVLYNIMDRPYLRIFYDTALREQKLREFAKEYGLEKEEHPDDFFELEAAVRSVNIKPRMPELLKVNEATTAQLKEQLLPKKMLRADAKSVTETVRKMILVIRKRKYYDQLNIEVYEGESGKAGKLKNPIVALDALDLIWKTNSLDEAKFFTGVSKFQSNYTTVKSDSDLEALRMIVNNPLGLDVYYHNREVSESIKASSIVATSLRVLEADIKLSVFKKDPFYEVSGELILKDKSHPFKSLNLKYGYFIQLSNTLHLVADEDMLRVIEFFKANHEKVIIHESKYDEFRQTILARLEHRINIHYSFIKPATKKQLAALNFETARQKIIYLSDEENYVLITPVMKYGQVEIPVLSRKQIYDADQNGNVFKVERDSEVENQFIGMLIRQHVDFDEQMHEGESFYLHKEKFLDENWFLEAFEAWTSQGIVILGFNELKKNRFNANKGKVTVHVTSGIDWFNAALNVTYGNQKASLQQLNKAIRNKSKFVQLDDGTLGILPHEWIKKLESYFLSGELLEELLRIPKSNFSEIDKLFDKAVLNEEVQQELNEYQALLTNVHEQKEIEIPGELNATLRDYQHQGLSWLNTLDDLNFGACLADDMGLGKTLQLIAFMLIQRRKQKQNTNLVVVPTSLLFNWQAEIARFAPSLKVFTLYGSNRAKNTDDFDKYEVILTTYGMLLSDITFLKTYAFNYVVLDESQAIKNPDSQRYKAARMLKARNRIVLTGTPIENNTFDLYGQLSFACPGLLGSKHYFRDVYSTPIDKFQSTSHAVELQQKIAPFVLRRTKREVAKELPDKTEVVIYCEMGEEQRKIYTKTETELREFISTKNEDEISKNSMHVLTGLIRLRQICNSPTLLKDEEHLGDFSTKIETLMEQIENKSPVHKILVFSQFVSMLDLIKAELQKKEIPFEYLTGQTKDREARVNKFQENKEVRVFLISLKAGGTGLNLTEADYVYLVDPWWNPAVENQAIDRCYRIGQKKNVIAVRLICPNTIEEKIMKLQQTKNRLADDLIKADGAILKSFSKTDLMGMLGS
ncbi:MAG: DEAD/DEAH box helicase family protein [Bacteroidetes bacterium]|nr:DEAD/DEAH box helicase family protein [Bacteroidota bacterium]